MSDVLLLVQTALEPLTEPLLSLLPLADPVPEDEDVKAGWVAFAIFGAMALAVVVLAFSLVKQLGKAQRAKDTGVYGDEALGDEGPDEPARTTTED